MLKVTLVHVIRHKVQAERRSQRAVARELRLSRNTIKRYLGDDVVPGVRVEEAARPRPVRSLCEEEVRRLLETERWTAKQRATSGRVVELLAAKRLVASERTVRRVMREWRRERREVGIPLCYRAGDLAEVDFFEVLVEVSGSECKAWMFLMRSMYAERDFAWLYPWEDQACFLDGHVRAFAHFGGVFSRLLYDNLRSAVKKVLVGQDRELNERFAALAAHYGFEPRFARPRRGDDKGGVEARGKGVRWQHLSPIPKGETLEAISEALLGRLDERHGRHAGRDGESASSLWEAERRVLVPLPPLPHDCAVQDRVTADRQARVRVRGARYSVPCSWKCLPVKVLLYADRVVLEHAGKQEVHARVKGGTSSIWYPHYLPELATKPQAIEQVAHVLFPQLGSAFERLWRYLEAQRGRREGARAMKAVLQAVVDTDKDTVARAIERAFETGDEPVLAIRPPRPPTVPASVPAVLRELVVEGPVLGAYDAFLGGAR